MLTSVVCSVCSATASMSDLSSPSATTKAYQFNKILNQKSSSSRLRTPEEVDEAIKKLRRLILVNGIPSDAVSSVDTRYASHYLLLRSQDPTIRPRLWKLLLRVNDVSADTYLRYVARGPCHVREKIRNDTFRYITRRSLYFMLLHTLQPEHLRPIDYSRRKYEKIC